MSEANLAVIGQKISQDRSFQGKDAIFDEDWGTECSLRIVSATDGSDVVVEGLALEPSYQDTGTEFSSWLNGSQSLADAISASSQMVPKGDIEPADVHTGFLKMPDAKRIQVEFACRRNATREEKDLAFLAALSEVADVGYLSVGELPAAA